MFVPNRFAVRCRQTHPITWLVYNVATSVAVVAFVWVVVGRTVGIFAAGCVSSLDLVLLLVTIARVRVIRRERAG